uniref:UDP-N-acetylenolpyruvoylglucosamine reductase n=1 Tax=candidate division WOR-3 bacterium TaxID=2052148 RepID=A0A7V4E479_UNCW3
MKIKEREPLRNHSYIRIGGPARFFVQVKSIEEIIETIDMARKMSLPYYIIGSGSNILFPDEGYYGIIIKMTELNEILISGNKATIKAGTQIPLLVKELQRAGLSGMEQLSEIPGTIGGAIAGNAGAFGREIGELFTEGVVLTPDGHLEKVSQKELNFEYRKSDLKKFGILVEATLKFATSSPEKIEMAMKEFKKKRRETQPVGELTLGSVFKNPEGVSAGYLLDKAGLKGYSIGGAKFSEKHANFIVNFNGATCKDVIELIEIGYKRVKEMFNIELEREIIVLNPFDNFVRGN